MTGKSIGAREALDRGIVERVVAPEALDAAVEAPLDASIRASINEFSRSYESGAPARAIAMFQAARRSRKG